MAKRKERDSMGEISISEDALWGAQTERTRINFSVGTEIVPLNVIYALTRIKKAAAITHRDLKLVSSKKAQAIVEACDEILIGKWNDQFPVSLWQSGSGTQTNMNVNEVVANRAHQLLGGKLTDENRFIHPNDDVNKSQSTNDTFPAAMHIAAYESLVKNVIPSARFLQKTLEKKAKEFKNDIKVGRTYEFEVPATGLFTPVWGWPCTNGGPGTLGNTCTEDQVVGAGKSWASAVESATGRSATPVVVPVLHSGFTMNQFVKLIPTAHANGTMVLLDTSGKVEDLRKGISQLTPFGLDGIVVDQEHNTALTFADVKQLAQEFARAREKAGLKGEGIVLVWDVFHSMGGSNADFGGVPGLRFVVINDGFGGSVAKWESLQKTRSHYGVTDNNRTGVMFFDRRWPVNSSCTSSNNTNGYDCQSWKAMLEIYPTLATLGWLAQQ
jgi:hypothetical protein